MKFKLFNLVWDMKPVIYMLWAFIGLMICVMALMIHQLGWWNIPYAVVTMAYLATSESLIKKLDTE